MASSTPATFGHPCEATCSSATNASFDISGVPDTRPGESGYYHGEQETRITFKPPAGYRVRILRVAGDVVAWKLLGKCDQTPDGAYRCGDSPQPSGVLFALHSTAPGGSKHGDFLDDSGLLYVQGGVKDQPFRASFDMDVSAAGLLEPDNVLRLKAAIFRHTTRRAIHIEPSFVVTYRFEAQQ